MWTQVSSVNVYTTMPNCTVWRKLNIWMVYFYVLIIITIIISVGYGWLTIL